MARRHPRIPKRRTLAQIAKDAEAAGWYRQGLTYQQVADKMGLRSKGSAYMAVQRAIADLTEDHVNAHGALELMLERIQDRRRKLQEIVDATHYLAGPGGKIATIWDEDLQKDVPVVDSSKSVQALIELRHLDDQEARLLDLYPAAKSRVEVVTTEQVEAESKRIVAKLVAEGDMTEAEAGALYALPAVPGAA